METESILLDSQSSAPSTEPAKVECEPISPEKLDGVAPPLPEPSMPAVSANNEENDIAIADSLNHIALTHLKKGNLQGALLMFQECLDIKRKIFLGDNASIADTLNNMAIIQNSLEHFDEAITLFSESLSMLRRLHPPYHTSVAETVNNIAGVYSNRGNFTEALPLYNECLQALSLAPVDELDLATKVETISNIALLYTKQGKS